MIPEGNPHGRVAGKSGREFKEDFTIRFWQPLSLQHLLPFVGTFDDVQLRLGIGWGFRASARTTFFGALRAMSGSRLCSSSSYYHSSYFASSSSSLCLCLHPTRYVLSFSLSLSLSFSISLSLSLSLLPLEVSVYLSIFSARLPSNVSAIKTETGAKLTAP